MALRILVIATFLECEYAYTFSSLFSENNIQWEIIESIINKKLKIN